MYQVCTCEVAGERCPIHEPQPKSATTTTHNEGEYYAICDFSDIEI